MEARKSGDTVPCIMTGVTLPQARLLEERGGHRGLVQEEGYLTHKKPPPRRILQKDYAQGPLWGS